MAQRVRYATRDELLKLLPTDPAPRVWVESVLDRLAEVGVDVESLVRVTVQIEGAELAERPGTAELVQVDVGG
jgi:hypothetical protein